MMDYTTTLLFLCPTIFLACFVDAISGGGGLLALPAYLFTGMPVHYAYGCNKFICCTSTAMSAGRFFKNGALDLKTALPTAVTAFLCSIGASKIVLLMDEHVLRVMLIVMLPFMALLILLKRRYPKESHTEPAGTKSWWGKVALTGILVGSYDGMFGPGSGTLAIVAFTSILHYDLKTASGNAKILILMSTFAGMLTYILAGKMMWSVVLPVAVCGLCGGYIGAGFAIKKGAKFIRPMMLVIAFGLCVKMVLEMV